MIINKSRQTGLYILLKVQEDLTKRGWIAIRSEEEQPYDLIVDMGIVDEERVFFTIQVKQKPRTSSRPGVGHDYERVSVNGKSRNNYWYEDENITLISSIVDGEVVYWHKDDYKKKKPIAFKSMKRYEFPINEKMFSYKRPQQVHSTLEEFFE
tara:strand:- start:49 stop:507 length:459 start_codon:yes stop_codon:yes gene_type:complete